jgi:hypothetical protein
MAATRQTEPRKTGRPVFDEVEAEIFQMMKQKNMTRAQAAAKVFADDPNLRERLLAESNGK